MEKEVLTKFKKLKTGYFLKGKRFIEIGEINANLTNLRGYKIYNYKNELPEVTYLSEGDHGIIGESEFIFVEPDTPQNRLAITLKYD